MDKLQLDHSKKYLIGVSGGSDSMALLSLSLDYKVVVCFVNYKLRANADKEEEIVKNYCQKSNIKVYCLYPKQENKDNFQKWAREARYQFYKDIYEKEKCDCLLLGHQLDDHLENYLMAKQRGSKGWYYGIQECCVLFKMNVYRPLLKYRKEQLREYCLNNKVPFGDDESNFSDKYTRNRIRHHLIQQADNKQIKTWLSEIEEYNKQINKKLDYIKAHYSLDFVTLADYLNEEKIMREIILRYYLFMQDPNKTYSQNFIQDIDQKIITKQKNLRISIDKNTYLICEYGIFYLCAKKHDYQYTYDKLTYGETNDFVLTNKGKTIEGITLKENDFPITIRNYHNGDVINMRFGKKAVNRFLIDRKIYYRQRISWLVVENNKKEIIFVDKMGCDVNHYSTDANLFVIKS